MLSCFVCIFVFIFDVKLMVSNNSNKFAFGIRFFERVEDDFIYDKMIKYIYIFDVFINLRFVMDWIYCFLNEVLKCIWWLEMDIFVFVAVGYVDFDVLV